MRLHLETQFSRSLKELFNRLENQLGLDRQINAIIAGGVAVHLYTASRVTTDVDAEFSARFHVPQDLVVEFKDQGRSSFIYFDQNYNSSFALMHEDYDKDAVPVNLGCSHIKTYILSPLDLAISKVARWADNDREDVQSLAKLKLFTAEDFEKRANEAIGGFIGNTKLLKINILEAKKEIENNQKLFNSNKNKRTTPRIK